MQTNVFYDIKKVPLADRESFNNTILLLTLVKSEFYYIIGFSRPDETITIGFDFESITEGKFTRELIIDFKSSPTEILLRCDVLNVDSCKEELLFGSVHNSNHFIVENGTLRYVDRIKKDEIIPSSIKSMNCFLLGAKKRIDKLFKLIG